MDREPLEATATETQGEPSGVEVEVVRSVRTLVAANVDREVLVCLAVAVVVLAVAPRLAAVLLVAQTAELVADISKAPPDSPGLVLVERQAEQLEPQVRQETMQEPPTQAVAAAVEAGQEPQLEALVGLVVYQAEAAAEAVWAALQVRLAELEEMAA